MRKIILFAFTLVLLIYGKFTSDGIRCGIELCVRVIIPSLFPLLVLSKFAIKESGQLRSKVLGSIFRTDEDDTAILLISLLGGFPMGALAVENALEKKAISAEDSSRLLGYCNCAGPAFIFGMAATLFPSTGYGFLLWLIQLISTVIAARIMGKTNVKHLQTQEKGEGVIHSSILSMAVICAWMLLACGTITLLQSTVFPYLPQNACRLITAIIELTNGMLQIASVPSAGQRLILTSALLSFGGVCVWLQIISVTPHISKKYFIPGTLLKTAISAVIACAVSLFF